MHESHSLCCTQRELPKRVRAPVAGLSLEREFFELYDKANQTRRSVLVSGETPSMHATIAPAPMIHH